MGLLQNAILTYDNNLSEIGKYYEKKEPLAPIAHIVTRADIIVTLDLDGEYIGSEKAPDEKVIIPVTEKSAGRSNNNAPHPLAEKIKYLASYDDKSYKKQQEYLKELKKWLDSPFADSKLKAVYSYVIQNRILDDLTKDGMIALKENGQPKKDDDLIIWKVIGSSNEARTWHDVNLMEKYTAFYLAEKERSTHNICAISGKKVPIAQQHIRGIFSLDEKAKLISANDDANFTYRDRFIKSEQALTVGYEASQKSHNALKWLISNHGVIIGQRLYLCWSPQNDDIPAPEVPLLEQFFKEEIPEVTTEKDYRDALSKSLNGYKSNLANIMQSNTILACFDAANSGRLAITFYSEMMTKDFLQRLKDWDAHCNWYWKKNEISSPALKRIVDYAYGLERNHTGNGQIDIDAKIERQAMERLVRCRVSRGLFPSDIERKLVENASNLIGYGRVSRMNLLFVTCAVIRKYYFDHYREELKMKLDPVRKDRSYQFGRLLSVYEKIERDALQGAGDTRETNAMRLQSVYCNRPLHYSFELEKQMERAYFPRLSQGQKIYYKNLIGEIMQEINSFEEKEWDRPLKDTYLMGYYLQRKELYTKKTNK